MCVLGVPGGPKGFTVHKINTSPTAARPPTRPSGAGTGPPAVLDTGGRPELASGEPGPHTTHRAQINRRLGAGTRVRHVRPGRPAPPLTHSRQRDGGGGPPHQTHGPRTATPGPGAGGFRPSRRPARTRPVPTAVRIGLPRRERRERRDRGHTARASRTSRRSAASARSSRPRSSARSSRVSTPTSPPSTTGPRPIGMAYLRANTELLGNSTSICAMSTELP